MRIFMLLSMLTIAFSACKDNEEKVAELEFFGTKWEVQKIQKDGDWQDATASYVLDFYSDNRFSLSLDVNFGGGLWSQTAPGEIEITGGGQTLVCCDSEFAKVMFEVIGSVMTYQLDGNVLMLEGDGKIVLKAI